MRDLVVGGTGELMLAAGPRPGALGPRGGQNLAALRSTALHALRSPSATAAALMGDVHGMRRILAHIDAPIVTLGWPFKLALVLDPGLAERVLHRSDEEFSVSRSNDSLWPLAGQHSMARFDGAPSRQIRRMVSESLAVRNVSAITRSAVEQFVDRWDDGTEIRVEPEMAVLARQILGELLLGPGFASVDVITENMTELFGIVDQLGWLFGRGRKAAVKRANELRAGIDAPLRRLVRSPSGEGVLRDRPIGRLLDDGHGEETLIDTVVSFLTIGAAGLSSTLAFALLECGRRPAWWSELARGATAPMTRAIVRETLRVHNPTATLSRVTTRDVDLGQVRIAKGVRVLILPTLLNSFESGADGFEFRPQRWIDGAEPERMAAFGVGPRKCPATGISPVILGTVLEVLGSRVRLVSPQPPWREVGLIARRPDPAVTCRVVSS
jgi:cytochrome P450